MKQFICTRSTNSDIEKGKVIKGGTLPRKW